MNDFLKYGYMNRTQSTQIDLVLAEMEEMKLTERDIIYNYDTLYSTPWAPHVNYEDRHRVITEVLWTYFRGYTITLLLVPFVNFEILHAKFIM